jgi:hypothetical protein
MAIFDPSSVPDQPLSVDVPEFVVRVSRVSPNILNPDQPPSWGAFLIEPSLKFLSAFCGSSVAGMSHARLQWVAGQPVDDPDARIETVANLNIGDRVIIAAGERPIFGGYCVSAQIQVEGSRETIIYSLAGPEWFWGGNPLEGCDAPIIGQIRRTAAADDALLAAIVLGQLVQTERHELFPCRDEPAVFNPRGRHNMTAVDLFLHRAGEAICPGRCFETPDRGELNGQATSEWWSIKEAAGMLLAWYNDPLTSGISNPIPEVANLPATRLQETSVDGLGLWEALRRVLAPDWNFYVDPRPATVDAWGPFAVKFFQRGEGDAGDVRLNAMGTRMADAERSIKRLEAAKDGRRCLNAVEVVGKDVVQVRLTYHGGATPTLAAGDATYALQHGWNKTEGNPADWMKNDPGVGEYIDSATVEAQGAAATEIWRKRFVRSGEESTRYAHVFRLFVWNEANEFHGADAASNPAYAGVDYNWTPPVLSVIVQGLDCPDVGMYARRRRPLLDTPYQEEGSPDQWRKLPAQVYLRAKKGDGTFTEWIRLKSGSDYRIDPDRAALWIVREDLARWQPLAERCGDYRSYMTLLHNGHLRLLVDACVETDYGLTESKPRTDQSGTYLVRSGMVRAGWDYVRRWPGPNIPDDPSARDALPVQTDAFYALQLAEQYQAAGQDLQTHCSIATAADWPLQTIGRVISATGGGRAISLRGGPSSRGAQVVGMTLDAVGMTVELLTESVALKMRREGRTIRRGKPAAAIAGLLGKPLPGKE